MPGLPASRPAPELPPGVRSALVIATSRYEDPEFRQLRSPGLDAAEFAEAIADPGTGGFTVTQLIDETEARIRRSVARFCANRGLDDLILIYLSCHGVLDGRGRLFFVASDTERQHLGATAVSSEWLLTDEDAGRVLAARQALQQAGGGDGWRPARPVRRRGGAGAGPAAHPECHDVMHCA
jgi:Caspase domain